MYTRPYFLSKLSKLNSPPVYYPPQTRTGVEFAQFAQFARFVRHF
jgi:hypothetical protein